ncbi:tetratricopeptide repeat protein [Aureisphaera galaxeae]|uniref:tetratricopeptide repeat protein n=1 Tax=Aureisphaera galaxeae TaxID=1538023 RepID=UPI00235050F4|nr:tetratricopeptide repeat protein [Aureisphaera galaxeae]MDC8004344.1 tetratricopeptide repeat protein [Aureisphaera galaxeae]
MKFFISLCFSFLFFISALGQNTQKVDSLLNALSEAKDDTEKITLHKSLFLKTYEKEPAVGKQYLDSIEAISFRMDPNESDFDLTWYKGLYYKRTSNFPLAETWLKRAIANFESKGDINSRMRAINELGNVERKMGKYKEAMNSIQLVLKLKQELNLGEVEIARSYVSLGNIHGVLQNVDLSTEYFKKAEAIYERNAGAEEDLAKVQGNIGLNHRKKKNYSEALSYYKKTLAYFDKAGYPIKKARVLHNINVLYRRWDSLPQAEDYALQSLRLTQEFNNPGLEAKNLLSLAKIAHIKGDLRLALDYYEKSIAINKEIEQTPHLIGNYKSIANVYADLGDFKKAFEYRVITSDMEARLYKRKNVDKVNELEVQYATERKEAEIALQQQEIKTLNEEVKVSNLTKTLYGIGMFAFLAITGLLYFGFKQRIKKNRIAREKQEAIYKQEIAFKKKELTSQTLHLVQKNTFIEELKSNLERIKESPELFKIEFRRLIMLLKKEKAEDKDWEVFKSYFSEVHNNFDLKLKEIYNEITEKEIRLASFLRMNLSTKEIASMLNVLPDSVLKSKYRLKKKLKLEKEDDLVSFLSTL